MDIQINTKNGVIGMDNKELLQAIGIMFTDFEKSMDAKLATLKSELVDTIDGLEARNAEQHTDIKESIARVEKEVKYIKHRLNKTDEDVFEIKDYLKIVK